MSILSIDLGGTKITGAIFDNEGALKSKITNLLNRSSRKEVGLLIRNFIDELVANYLNNFSELQAIGICVPVIANIKTGKIWAPNIPGWEDYLLHKVVSLQIKIIIVNHCLTSFFSN